MAEHFDQAFKLSNDEDAQGTLKHVLGIDVPEEAQFEVLDRELNLNRQHADHLYRVRAGAEETIHLAEAYTHYSHGWRKSMLEHAVMASMKYDLPTFAHLVLFQKKGTPENLPAAVTVDRGGLRHLLAVNVIRLWERPAREVLESEQVGLYPWVALMDSTVEEQRQAARQVAPVEALRMRMALFGGLRYGSLQVFLERIGNMLSVEQLRGTTLWKELTEEGRAEGLRKGLYEGQQKGRQEGLQEGRQKGLQEGLLEGERRMLGIALQARFGTLPAWAEHKVANAKTEDIERWMATALDGRTLEAILQ